MEERKTINDIYFKVKTIGSGGQGKAYLVEDKDNNQYVAKIIEPKDKRYDEVYLLEEKEINKKIQLFNKINSIGSPYLTHFYEGGVAEFKKNGKLLKKRNYFIFDYCSYYDLLIILIHEDLNEGICKLIFKKIVLGVQALHNAGIYHRDLKLDNIVIDNKYNPKICDYDHCTEQQGILKDTDKHHGTKAYMPYEILEGKEYSPEKADIYSLGCLLFILVVHNDIFSIKEEEEDKYKNEKTKLKKLIKENRKDEFFKKLEIFLGDINKLKKEFRDLCFAMISSEDKRPTLDEIINSKWLCELNNVKIENKIQNEMEIQFNRIKNFIDEKLNNNPCYLENFGVITSSKGGLKKKYKFFKPNLKINYKDIDLEGEFYIKIFGNKFEYCDFMDYFVKEIEEKEKVEVSDYNDGYKCNIIFKGNENEEDLIIKLKLYKTEDEEYNGEYYDGYLLRFLRTSGELSEYYEKVKKISSMGKEILKNHLY